MLYCIKYILIKITRGESRWFHLSGPRKLHLILFVSLMGFYIRLHNSMPVPSPDKWGGKSKNPTKYPFTTGLLPSSLFLFLLLLKIICLDSCLNGLNDFLTQITYAVYKKKSQVDYRTAGTHLPKQVKLIFETVLMLGITKVFVFYTLFIVRRCILH